MLKLFLFFKKIPITIKIEKLNNVSMQEEIIEKPEEIEAIKPATPDEIKAKMPKVETHQTERSLVSVLALNVKGQLGRITTFFSEHNLNILRLVLSAADKDDKIHRTIAYLEGDRKYVNAMCKELEKVENVVKVTNFQTNEEYIEKEMCLVKISSYNEHLQDIVNLVTSMEGKTIYMNGKITIFKIENSEDIVNQFMANVVNITKDVEICRSGMVAIALDEKIDVL